MGAVSLWRAEGAATWVSGALPRGWRGAPALRQGVPGVPGVSGCAPCPLGTDVVRREAALSRRPCSASLWLSRRRCGCV